MKKRALLQILLALTVLSFASPAFADIIMPTDAGPGTERADGGPQEPPSRDAGEGLDVTSVAPGNVDGGSNSDTGAPEVTTTSTGTGTVEGTEEEKNAEDDGSCSTAGGAGSAASLATIGLGLAGALAIGRVRRKRLA